MGVSGPRRPPWWERLASEDAKPPARGYLATPIALPSRAGRHVAQGHVHHMAISTLTNDAPDSAGEDVVSLGLFQDQGN